MEAFISGGALPSSLHNTTWDGLLHASDWYLTLTEGVAGVFVNPAMTGGPRPLDGFNAWPAILAGAPSPRTEVIHQVNNSFFDERASSIRVGDFKLLRGIVGDDRIIAWPERVQKMVPVGLSGAVIEHGTDHVRGEGLKLGKDITCIPYCLYNVQTDRAESTDLASDPTYR